MTPQQLHAADYPGERPFAFLMTGGTREEVARGLGCDCSTCRPQLQQLVQDSAAHVAECA